MNTHSYQGRWKQIIKIGQAMPIFIIIRMELGLESGDNTYFDP